MMMLRPRGAPFLFLTTAAFFSVTVQPLTASEAYHPRGPSSNNNNKNAADHYQSNNNNRNCPFYGCPLTPLDVHYNTQVIKDALVQIREHKRTALSASFENDNLMDHEAAATLATAATDEAAMFTLIGYKGGDVAEQVNQDRGLVVSPFYLTNNNDDDSNAKKDHAKQVPEVQRILLGVFDGHAPLGELVSDYAQTELPKLLATKLAASLEDPTTRSKNGCGLSEQQEIELTKRALHETFVELDKTAPADPSGGCTATVILQQGSHIYVANAGDSRSFLVAYRPSTGQSQVVYISREDKPNLPDERARVEASGGQVYIPVRGTSRVVYHDTETGAPTGLAMSRSIGDWEAGKIGVIPDPIVDVLTIPSLVRSQLNNGRAEISEKGQISQTTTDDDDVYLYAVSATDGMMDYLQPEDIAKVLSHSLFHKDGVHPITACEHLIFAAANGWQKAKQGRYRDDIAIAVSTIRRPPQNKDAVSQY